MVWFNQNKMRRGVVIACVVAIAGCGARPTIPVEEHSSVKPPKKRELYYRAAPAEASPAVVELPAAVAATAAAEEPITYRMVEPAPLWQEIPPTQEPPPPLAHAAVPRHSTNEAPPSAAGTDPLQGMVEKIEQAMREGEYQRAEGLLERALRIDSQRPGLWHDLAQVRYQQHAYQEAVTLARRSNSFATAGSVLQEENWSLIARAKEALGDLQGAQQAWQKAGQ